MNKLDTLKFLVSKFETRLDNNIPDSEAEMFEKQAEFYEKLSTIINSDKDIFDENDLKKY